jgi:hypothetical protein
VESAGRNSGRLDTADLVSHVLFIIRPTRQRVSLQRQVLYRNESEREREFFANPPAGVTMACNHLGPIDIMQLAEERLGRDGVAPELWEGIVYGFGENVTGSQWTSVYTEIERRGGTWVVIKIDRMTTPLDPAREGLVRAS